MSTAYEIPLSPQPQFFSITLGGVQYKVLVCWSSKSSSWMINFADADGNAILTGIPLVTGVDLLGQYGYLGFKGQLVCQTDNDLFEPPTYDNIGTRGHVYFLVSG